jgi:hypothetical protein
VTKEIDGKPADHGFIPFRDYVVCHGGLFEDGSRVNPMELLKFRSEPVDACLSCADVCLSCADACLSCADACLSRDSLPHTAIYGFWPPPTWIVRTTREKLDQAFDEGNVEGANYSSFIEIFRVCVFKVCVQSGFLSCADAGETRRHALCERASGHQRR